VAAEEPASEDRSGRAGRRRVLSADVVPLLPEHRDAAATLLVARHRRERRHEPLLPALDVAAARALVDGACAMPGAVGHAAIRGDGAVHGVLLGAPLRSRAAIVPAAGWVVNDVALLSPLLAALGRGLPRAELHVQVGAHDDAGHAAFAALGFRDLLTVALASLPVSAGTPGAVAIRQAGPDDLDAMIALAQLQQAHHAAPPMSLAPPAGDDDAERARQQRLLDDPRTGVWLARAGRRVVGMLVLQPPGAIFSRLHLPEAAVHLPEAIVVPDARGRGVTSALLAEALGWVHAIGYRHVALHVHAANAPARRFWVARGFRTIAHQLVRDAVTS
jgi:ribosomal protein S18 acetylase RimI-like enzyme